MVLLVRYFLSFFFVLFCLLFKLTNIHSGNSSKLKIDDFKTSNQPTFLALMNTKTLQKKKKEKKSVHQWILVEHENFTTIAQCTSGNILGPNPVLRVNGLQ